MEKKKCDCMIYLADYDYEGHHPVYQSEMKSWEHGDDRIYFNFCPICGEKIDRPQ